MFTMRLLIITIIPVLLHLPLANASVDPYDSVALITNNVAWPYNDKTFGNDSYQQGSSLSGNIDSLLLDMADGQSDLKFPDGMLFGVAHSAYQYEGNRVKPTPQKLWGVGWSLWDAFSEKLSWLNPTGNNISAIPPTSNYTQPNGSQAIQGYYPKFYQQDMQLANKLGVKVFRMSVSWPRLFPHQGMSEPDPEGVKYYEDVLKELKAQGFEVMLTLYHWDLPAWLYNYGDSTIKDEDKTYGWLDSRQAQDNLTISEYQKYVDTCFRLFGKYTPWFTTFNEPLTFTNNGLYIGNHAPGKQGFELLRAKDPLVYGTNPNESDRRINYLQSSNIIKAHFIAYKTFEKYRVRIRKANNGKAAELGIALNADWPEPYRIIRQNDRIDRYHPDDIAASKRNLDFNLGWWLEPIMYGKWPASMLKAVGDRLPKFSDDSSCLNAQGQAIHCAEGQSTKLADYIKQGGALDNITLNHYTAYFVADLAYAKSHFSTIPHINSIPPDQYGTTPNSLMPGWAQDQSTFTTQFRYQKYGSHGNFASSNNDRAYIIGKAGAQSWLRHSYFAYTKLLNYINHRYLRGDHFSKQNAPFSSLSVYLTENGTSLYGESQKDASEQLNDPDRVTFIKGNLVAVWLAIKSGVDVKLYTYWSIADNFEWAEGYDSRFGLVWIDYADRFARKLKQSYHYYQQVIKNNKIMP